jgi:hypothetical protein
MSPALEISCVGRDSALSAGTFPGKPIVGENREEALKIPGRCIVVFTTRVARESRRAKRRPDQHPDR